MEHLSRAMLVASAFSTKGEECTPSSSVSAGDVVAVSAVAAAAWCDCIASQAGPYRKAAAPARINSRRLGGDETPVESAGDCDILHIVYRRVKIACDNLR